MEQVQVPWKSTKDGFPEKLGQSRYEHVYCLVITKYGCVKVLAWNCEEHCWDKQDGDDYACDAFEVSYYFPLDNISTPEL